MDKNDKARLVAASDLLVAGALLTRLPLPHAPDAAFARSAQAGWCYPLVGAVLAGLAGVVWSLCGVLALPGPVQAGVTLAALVAMTGALHEDGLADTADGLWGGHAPVRRLEIMKDSRIGSYGVLALVFGIGLRWLALGAAGPWALLAAASLSRAVLPAMMAALPFARPDGLARSVGAPSAATAALALGIGTVVAIWAVGPVFGLVAALVAGLAAALVGWVAVRKIGGITGDICGAAQQCAELVVLLALVA
jgi:adenosylcobinamide-GDP ribazoletransferase